MSEVFRGVPEAEAIVRRPGDEVTKQPEVRRTIQAELIGTQGKSARKTGMVEYTWASRAIDAYRERNQPREEAEGLSFWKLMFLLIMGAVSGFTDSEEEAEK